MPAGVGRSEPADVDGSLRNGWPPPVDGREGGTRVELVLTRAVAPVARDDGSFAWFEVVLTATGARDAEVAAADLLRVEAVCDPQGGLRTFSNVADEVLARAIASLANVPARDLTGVYNQPLTVAEYMQAVGACTSFTGFWGFLFLLRV